MNYDFCFKVNSIGLKKTFSNVKVMLNKLIFKFNFLLLQNRLIYLLVFVTIQGIITVSLYQILFTKSVAYCAFPFDTWSSVYDIDNPENLMNHSQDGHVISQKNHIDDESKDETFTGQPFAETFNPHQEAANLYTTFLQNKKTCDNIRQAAMQSLPGADHAIFNRPINITESNCTRVKLSLYAIAVNTEGTELACLVKLIAIYDLYAAALDLGASASTAIATIDNLPESELRSHVTNYFNRVNQLKGR